MTPTKAIIGLMIAASMIGGVFYVLYQKNNPDPAIQNEVTGEESPINTADTAGGPSSIREMPAGDKTAETLEILKALDGQTGSTTPGEAIEADKDAMAGFLAGKDLMELSAEEAEARNAEMLEILEQLNAQ